MNEISEVYNYLIDLFDNNNLVNTISIVPTIEMDNNKENIYPLVNIDYKGQKPDEQVLILDFEITIVQQRNTGVIKTDSKLLDNTNYIDNLNETNAIAMRFINVIESQNNSFNIELDSLTKLTPLKLWRNSLDGHQFTISVSIPNKGQSC